jgi:lipoyl(octanoyl) transferase
MEKSNSKFKIQNSKFRVEDWGLTPYGEALNRQTALFDRAVAAKVAGEAVENILVFCEHPNVITLGKHGKQANLLFSADSLRAMNVEFFPTNRGGDITYHGPGQTVGYPIFDLDSFHIGLKEYIFRIEEVIILLLNEYGIVGQHLEGASGVWLDIDNPARVRKICAIGVRSSRFVTMHGFALNVNTDLRYFDLINPCGFTDRGVTSMQRELGREIAPDEVKSRLTLLFNRFFPA